jgi:hypothetical protein
MPLVNSLFLNLRKSRPKQKPTDNPQVAKFENGTLLMRPATKEV